MYFDKLLRLEIDRRRDYVSIAHERGFGGADSKVIHKTFNLKSIVGVEGFPHEDKICIGFYVHGHEETIDLILPKQDFFMLERELFRNKSDTFFYLADSDTARKCNGKFGDPAVSSIKLKFDPSSELKFELPDDSDITIEELDNLFPD